MNFKITPLTRTLLKRSLQEDIGTGDLATQTLIPKYQKGKAYIVARESGVFAGGFVVREVFRLRDASLRVKLHVKEGGRVQKGRRAVTVIGCVQSILEAERVALNFLGRLSGIATLTRAFVDKIRGTRAKIFDTRKTTPLWRELEKYAVRCGGGKNHRFGLWDEILVKNNHWQSQKFLCLLSLLAQKTRRRKIPLEIEVRNLKELARLLEASFVPDRILLDNFPLRELRRAVIFVHGLDYILRKKYGIRRKRPLLEASGGIELTNVRTIAKTGVDRISVGRLTHSPPALDYSLRLLKSS